MAERIVALLGGDQRELLIVPALKSAGYTVRCFGLPEGALPEGVEACGSAREAAAGAGALLLPLPGIREDGRLYAPYGGSPVMRAEDLAGLAAGTPVLVGVASAYLKEICGGLGLPVWEIAELDAVARPNAIPTAEGAIQLAMEELPLTIDGLRALVLGFGRVGEALSLRLRALGAEVTVSNRGKERFAQAAKQGFGLYPWGDMAECFGRMDVIFNTVPAQVLDKARLLALPKEVLVIDLSSGAGGVDYELAAELGIRAIHALSLPGKVAPVSAGRLLAAVYPKLLGDIFNMKKRDFNSKGKRVIL